MTTTTITADEIRTLSNPARSPWWPRVARSIARAVRSDAEARRVRRDVRQPAHALSLDAKWLSAGDEYLNARRARQDQVRALGCRLDDVLTTVEHDQHLAVSQMLAQRGERVRGVFSADAGKTWEWNWYSNFSRR